MLGAETATERKEGIDPRSIAICAATFYKTWMPGERTAPNIDIDRGDASLQAFELAQRAGYQMVVVDGGSSDAYLNEARERGVLLLSQQEKSISSAKRQAFKAAQESKGCRFIILIQPEKDSIIKDVPQIIRPIYSDGADVVVASRDPILFRDTYPSFQYESENWANRQCNRIAHLMKILPLGANLDWFFGVKVFRNTPEIVALFVRKFQITDESYAKKNNLDPERYFDVDFFPIVEALRIGKRVVDVQVPFEYPRPQKEMEETLQEKFVEKRRLQRRSILTEYVQYFRLLTKSQKNKLMESEA
ncbi:MAG: hypothetical protein M1484_00655 [Patescibacteria group bacterium]|nr:hypothetical protein [Patescibacteria group bacterium]MCL5431590.1 hypothetical protein [Patescibacteria group bacterium]